MGTGFFPLMKSGILFIKQTVSTEYSGSPAQNKPSGIPPPHKKKSGLFSSWTEFSYKPVSSQVTTTRYIVTHKINHMYYLNK